ncbi:MAG: polysaccharide biosynthesis protein [Clostridiales bacterium]|nr:polysaccharide biosynthesis protein [Clostridiales bacterium]
MGKQKKQSFVQGALILSLAVIISKIVGALFKIPLQMMSPVAFGYFNAAYEIYVPISTIAMAGLPIAVSRMVSESITLGRYRDVRMIYRVAVKVFLITGTVGSLLMFILSFVYVQVTGLTGALGSMLVMSPTIFFCCLMSAHRGLYEGTRNMAPTATSQVIEALGKLLLGLGGAYGMLMLGRWQFHQGMAVFGQAVETIEQADSQTFPFVAAGAMLGVTLGSLLALIYMVVRHHKHGTGMQLTREEIAASPRPRGTRVIFRALLAIAIPVALGSLATQVTNLIDSVSLQWCLKTVIGSNEGQLREIYNYASTAGLSADDFQAWLGAIRGTALTYVNLVPNFTLTFGISALPVVTAAWVSKNKRQLKGTVESVLRITLLIALPAGVGLTVMAGPIMHLIYASDMADASARLLTILGLSTVFICLIAPINSILQAVGRADIPVKVVLVGGAIKLALNLILILQPSINIMGSAYSTLVCYVVMVFISLIALRRVVGVRMRWRTVFLKPLISALCCGAAAWAANGLLSRAIPGKLATVAAVCIAGLVYIVVLLLAQALTKEDVLMLPKGQKIAQILEKHNWIG